MRCEEDRRSPAAGRCTASLALACRAHSDGRNHYSRVPAGSAVPTLFPSPSTHSLSFWVDFSFTVVILMLPRFSHICSSHHVLVTVFLIICVTTFTSGKETLTSTVLFYFYFSCPIQWVDFSLFTSSFEDTASPETHTPPDHLSHRNLPPNPASLDTTLCPWHTPRFNRLAPY